MEIGSRENIVFVEVQENERMREHEVMAARYYSTISYHITLHHVILYYIIL